MRYRTTSDATGRQGAFVPRAGRFTALLVTATAASVAANTAWAEDRASASAPLVATQVLTSSLATRGFLRDAPLRRLANPDRVARMNICSRLGSYSRCPRFAVEGAAVGGSTPAIVDEFAWGPAQNLRVRVFVQEIENDAVSNGGVQFPNGSFKFVHWETTGSGADIENGGPYGWAVPNPGQTYDEFGSHGTSSGMMVYDAIVFDGCGSFGTFPLQHESRVSESGFSIGSFTGTDYSTLDANGQYDMSYHYRVTDSTGSTSDISVRGKVTVGCTGENAL